MREYVLQVSQFSIKSFITRMSLDILQYFEIVLSHMSFLSIPDY